MLATCDPKVLALHYPQSETRGFEVRSGIIVARSLEMAGASPSMDLVQFHLALMDVDLDIAIISVDRIRPSVGMKLLEGY